MIIGIVGSEAAKFTFSGELKAKEIIKALVTNLGVTEVVSGGCHLGGIDIWAREIALETKKTFTEYVPQKKTWEFYKKRNLLIAQRSDLVYCITVDKLPDNYRGMSFTKCYHCKTDTHVKSGGCWTMKQAKQGILIVVQN